MWVACKYWRNPNKNRQFRFILSKWVDEYTKSDNNFEITKEDINNE